MAANFRSDILRAQTNLDARCAFLLSSFRAMFGIQKQRPGIPAKTGMPK